MTQHLLPSFTIFIYSIVTVFLLYRLFQAGKGLAKNKLLVLGLFGVLTHTYLLYAQLTTTQGIDLSFFTVFSLVAWLVSLLVMITAVQEPVENLMIIALPIAAAAVLMRHISDQHHVSSLALSLELEAHILVSIIAYSLLSIAAVQAVLLYVQERQLRNKHPGGFMRALPPLETMERFLFRMIGLGFIVLSISLFSGIVFIMDVIAHDELAKSQPILHKTVLSFCAWLLFAILLWGRWRFGWRGRVAIRWTLTGFVFLLLAYFGSKFVSELILKR